MFLRPAMRRTFRTPDGPVEPRHQSPLRLKYIFLPRAHNTRADYTAGVVPPECMQHASCHATLLSRSEGPLAVSPEYGSGSVWAPFRGPFPRPCVAVTRKLLGPRDGTEEKRSGREDRCHGQGRAAQQVTPSLFSPSVCIDLVGFRGRHCLSSRPHKHHSFRA